MGSEMEFMLRRQEQLSHLLQTVFAAYPQLAKMQSVGFLCWLVVFPYFLVSPFFRVLVCNYGVLLHLSVSSVLYYDVVGIQKSRFQITLWRPYLRHSCHHLDHHKYTLSADRFFHFGQFAFFHVGPLCWPASIFTLSLDLSPRLGFRQVARQ